MVESEKVLDCIKSGDGGVYLDLKISPNAEKNSIEGVNPWRNNLTISIKAEPREGRANQELIDFLSDMFHIDMNMIKITKGAKTSQKRIFFTGSNKKKLADKIMRSLDG
ncbi:MAG: DUF167 domain-containing protein [Thermoplasmatota archaeon]